MVRDEEIKYCAALLPVGRISETPEERGIPLTADRSVRITVTSSTWLN